MSANVKNIMANANLTEAEGKVVLDNLAVAADLFPFFKDKLSGTFSAQSTDDIQEQMDEMSGKNLEYIDIICICKS